MKTKVDSQEEERNVGGCGTGVHLFCAFGMYRLLCKFSMFILKHFHDVTEQANKQHWLDKPYKLLH